MKKGIYRVLAIVVALTMAFMGCIAFAEEETIKIGVSAALTGPAPLDG